MRYSFNEGLLSLLLQEHLDDGRGRADEGAGGGGEEEEEEAISEISIKTFDVSEVKITEKWLLGRLRGGLKALRFFSL